MKKFVTAFFMAWGNFLSLPCPYKRWDGKLKNMMLAMLPGVGLVAGVLWVILGLFLQWLMIPEAVFAIVMVLYLFRICGFMHMDGFMDVNDAVMSRRPLEDRRRILKDSTVGAFAVISIIFLVLVDFAAMYSIVSVGLAPDIVVLGLIPVISRAISGICVLSFKPMETSQYAEDHKESTSKYVVAALIFAIIVITLFGVILWSSFKVSVYRAIITAICTGLGTLISCLYVRHDLQGMNGDIAGYSICMGEAAGLLALAILL